MYFNERKIKEFTKQRDALKKELYKEKRKRRRTKNLSIYGSFFKLIGFPIILSSTIITGGLCSLGFRLPFYLDNEKHYKHYIITNNDGEIKFSKEYQKKKLFYTHQNYLCIYTPWEKKDSNYTRVKREYQIDIYEPYDFTKSIMDNDYRYTYNNIQNYKEEIQTINMVDDSKKNDYMIYADIDIIDKKDVLSVKEDDEQNIWTTIVNTLGILSLGSLIIIKNKNKYVTCKKIIHNIYDMDSFKICGLQEKIKYLDKRIVRLKKGGYNGLQK